MSAEIIQFAASVANRPRKPGHKRELTDARTGTLTAKNRSLRGERKKEWRRAHVATKYWKALLGFITAAAIARIHKMREAECQFELKDCQPFVDKYRAALGKQLLTPAPDVASVNWKRAHMKEPLIGVEPELVERAIADDMMFLTAHPTRGPKKEASR
jgi:hypothetical protein